MLYCMRGWTCNMVGICLSHLKANIEDKWCPGSTSPLGTGTVEYYEKIMSETVDAIEKYLGAGVIKGVSVKQQKIVKSLVIIFKHYFRPS